MTPAKFHHRVNLPLVGEVLAIKAARRMIAGTVVDQHGNPTGRQVWPLLKDKEIGA